jgi:hypothetical protein
VRRLRDLYRVQAFSPGSAFVSVVIGGFFIPADDLFQVFYIGLLAIGLLLIYITRTSRG